MESIKLPSGWTSTDLGSITISMSNGIGGNQNKEGRGLPVSRIETIADESVNFSRIGFIEEYDETKVGKYRLKRGEILFSHINSPVHLGKTALFDTDRELYHGINLLRIIANEKVVCPRLLNYYCKYSRAAGEFSIIAQHAVNQSSLNQKKLKAFSMPLPPLAEQTRIANKLDELLAQVDTIKARVDAIPGILKRFRQSVLSAAVSGRLTEEWRSENPEIALVSGNHLHSEQLEPIERHDYDLNLPDSWALVRLGAQVALVNGDRGKNYPNRSEYVEDGLPFINTGHIEPDGTLAADRMNYITREKFDSLGGGKIKKGDLVYCLRGATMGKTAMVDQFEEGAIASSLVIVRPSDFLLTKYAYFYLVSPIGKSHIASFDNGSAQPNLSAKSLSLFPLTLPSVDEQREIVSRVESLLAFSEQIETRIDIGKSRADSLVQSILAKAFRGELVPQDPDDEPASVLLERIRGVEERFS